MTEQITTNADGSTTVSYYDASGNFVRSVTTGLPLSPQQQAATDLQQMAMSDLPTFTSQLQTDIQTITSTGWSGLDAQTQHDIMLRVLNGFGSAITAIHTHAIATGVLTS